MKSLQIDHKPTAAENLHAMLSVFQQLRTNLEQDAENLNRMQCDYVALVERNEKMGTILQSDKEIINQQRNQIGELLSTGQYTSLRSSYSFQLSTIVIHTPFPDNLEMPLFYFYVTILLNLIHALLSPNILSPILINSPIKCIWYACTIYIDKAWGERDVALLREQNAQIQMHTMRDKLKEIEKESRKTEACSRDE